MTEWTNTILQGLLLGGLYALFATGLSLTFGIMRIVNVAHGDLIIVSAYMAYWLVETFSINPFYSLAIVIPIMAVVGYVLQRGVLS
ncbi:MAG: branched-chain amino acid ABC transporter permease, partial [Magnetospirillum sp.]|nr:branched-chain amino acid ABC transporter permease [Magnetospirillum sp.]